MRGFVFLAIATVTGCGFTIDPFDDAARVEACESFIDRINNGCEGEDPFLTLDDVPCGAPSPTCVCAWADSYNSCLPVCTEWGTGVECTHHLRCWGDCMPVDFNDSLEQVFEENYR